MELVKIKKLLYLLLFATVYARADIIARPAMMSELEAILELDRRVTFEFFLPLFVTVFNHHHIKTDPVQSLGAELADDKRLFPEYIKALGNERLYVAWDNVQNVVCGLIVFHKEEDDAIMIDLLLVDQGYRRRGVAKNLVYSIYTSFDEIKAIKVYPLQFNNEIAIKFYESVGFKNLGAWPTDKINSHGVKCSDMYYYFKLESIC